LKIGYFFLAAFFISLGIVIFGDVGLLSAYKVSQENASLELRIETLQRENARLLHDIESIQRSGNKQEHMVRTSLSLLAPDELLFEFQ
jgi:cell division protein FtsB